MRFRKRLSAIILAVVMVTSSIQLPGGTVHAALLPGSSDGTVTDNGNLMAEQAGTDGGSRFESETGSDAGSRTAEDTEGTAADDGSLTDDKTGTGDGNQSGVSAGTGDETQEGSEAGTENGSQTGDEAGADDGNQPGYDAGMDDENRPEDKADETEESGDDEKDFPDEDDTDDSASDEDNTLKEEDFQESLDNEDFDMLQISGNDVETSESVEIIIEGELEGVYQFGGAPSKRGGLSTYAVSEQSDDAEEYLYQKMLACETQIDLSSYQIPVNDWSNLVSGVINEHPELYFVKKNYSASHNGTYVLSIFLAYDNTLDDAAVQKGIEDALSMIDDTMSDLEKAIILHDYLVVNCEYDKENLDLGTVPDVSHTIYGVFANRMAVCDGYALAYKYLLNRVGIECHMVTSKSHAWNMIVLDGKYYQVDVTWDDPTWDRIGRVVHTYMFRSDAGFSDHEEWNVTVGSAVVNYTATDTRFDSAFWTECTSPLVIQGNDCYYVASEGTVNKASLTDTKDAGIAIQNIGSWTVWGSTLSSYKGAFSGLFEKDGRLFYNDKSSIYSISTDGTDKRIEFTADTTIGYIYGSAYCQGKVLYCLHQNPNLTARETVLTAELAGGSTVDPDIPKPGVGALDLDNLYAEYTALDDSTITSFAEGRPKLLIFYSNTCGNSQFTISNISSKNDSFAGVDVYAIETNKKTKEEVAEFQQQYGCADIVFSYDTGMINSNSMWAYVEAAGLSENGKITWPIICYIDANNRLQYITSSLAEADAVLSNLKDYCGYSAESSERYTITYILNGGTNNSANPTGYTPETDTIVLRDPVRDGYKFEGWYQDAAFRVKVTEIIKGSKGNLTLYAKWSEDPTAGLPQVDMTLTDGNVIMGFSGSYYTETADKILGRLNAIRKEACQQGVLNPLTGSPLTMNDYVPLEWSSDLEAIARLRAAEASVNNSHRRLNNKSCFTVVTNNNVKSMAENLAWNNDGLMSGIEQWYAEKSAWVNKTGGETGHYTSIINPEYRHVAVGAFRLSIGGWYSVAQEFSTQTSMDTQKNPAKGSCIQYMEVDGGAVSGLAFDKNTATLLREGDVYKLPLNVTVTYDDYYQNAKKHSGPYLAGGRWKSSDPAVATVDSEGTVTAIAKGTTTITARSALTTTDIAITVYGADENPVSVQPPAKTTYKVGEKLNISGGKVTYMSDGRLVTVSLSSSMVSGFDSSKPGICPVSVTYAGYKADFDTLIVEEPRLTAAYGQRLGDIPLPGNDYGTYSWRDEVDTTQELKEVGEHTYGAVFTPKDPGKFQQLTDLQITVVTQRTLGNDIDVVFKNSIFTYNGVELEPKVVVSAGDVVLTEEQDYTLSYENNRNVGTATVYIDGQNCYNGRISRTFEIKPAQLVIKAKDITVVAKGEEKPQIPEKDRYPYEASGLMEGDSLLTGPVFSCTTMDYDRIGDQKAPGRYEIIPSGADAGENYAINYAAGWLTVAEEGVSCAVRFDVQGHGAAPDDVIGVKVGSTIDKPSDPAEAGYRFDGWYQDPACTKPWNFDTDIVQADITLYAKWLLQSVDGSSIFALQEISDVYYTGKACKPTVSVYDGEILLKAGRDYQIKYYNNINANKGGVQKQGNGAGAYFDSELPYVEIIGKGNYTDKMNGADKDTVKVNFNILRTSIGDGSVLPASGVTLKVSDQLVAAKRVQKPFSSIKYSKVMKQGTDYTLCLETVNARDQSGKSLATGTELENAAVPAGYEGEFLLTVEGIGNYTGSVCKPIYVTDRLHLIKNTQITLGKNLKNIEFTGSAVRLTPSESSSADTFMVKCGGSVLRYRKDYLVSYCNNDRVGKAQLVITGMGEYVGEKAVTFNIKGRSFAAKTVTVDGLEDLEYTGKAMTQNGVKLTYGDGTGTSRELVYGTDYTISYLKNINQGTATMTFKGMDQAGFSGSFKKTFKITPYQISKENIWREDILAASAADSGDYFTVSYSKSGAKPVVKLVRIDRDPMADEAGAEGVQTPGQNKVGEVFLVNGKDYTLKYKNNKMLAKASDENPPTVIVKGKGNYGGGFEIPFTIKEGDLRGSDITVKTTPLAYNSNKAADYVYKPAVKLTDGKTALRAGVDYEISYRNNTQADFEAYLQKYKQTDPAVPGGMSSSGDAQAEDDAMPRAVITAVAGGNYTLAEPVIVPLPVYETKLTKANLQVEVEEAVYTGVQVTPQVTVTYLGESSPRVLSEGKDYTVSYGANVKSGRNKGTVTISGTGPLYGGSVTVKFEILKKPITY